MDQSEGRNAVLIDGLDNTAFYEALVTVIANIRSSYDARLHSAPKTDQLNEHIMSLMLANGACVALDALEADIVALRKEAVAKHI